MINYTNLYLFLAIYLVSGLFMAHKMGEKSLNFRKYNNDDWANFMIDIIIGFPMQLKFIIKIVWMFFCYFFSTLLGDESTHENF